MINLVKVRTWLSRHEGRIDHMYLDTVGCVTVGVGKMLPDVESAQALAFRERNGDIQADEDVIGIEYNLIARHPPGRLASYYRQYTILYLPDIEIDRLLDEHVQMVIDGLRQYQLFRDTMTDDQQLGMIDMGYNLGIAGLVKKFPKFCVAVRNGDWIAGAHECKRPQLGTARNTETAELFIKEDITIPH